MKYAVVTFGCRVNQADSLGFEADLLARGATSASPDTADLVVVNTCSVTATADQGARQTVRRIARSNPAARIVVTGCYATRCEAEVAALPNVIRVVRNPEKDQFGTVLDRLDVTSAERFGDGDGSCGATIEPGVAGRTAFTLRVQTGCSQPCAYCIIPITRGAPRSVPIDALLPEITRATRAGFREIALTGVHLGAYGRDLTPVSSLMALLQSIRDTTAPDVRFRISSLEPMDCSSSLVQLVRSERCFAPHFHLPLQHASDRMLKRMRRPYGIRDYANLVDGIRDDIPDASIGSDVIVGFPGETEADFDELIGYIDRSPLTHVHVFPYSDRPGTAASAMGDKVPGTVVRQRARAVRDASARLASAFRAGQLGRTHRALTLEDGTLVVTGNFLKVRIPPGHARNEWLDVTVTSVGPEALTGTVVSKAVEMAEG